MNAEEALKEHRLGVYRMRRPSENLVRVVHIIPEDKAKVGNGLYEPRISYRVVGINLNTLQADTWKFPSGSWCGTDKHERDLVEYTGED